jgi:hypothetical protein
VKTRTESFMFNADTSSTDPCAIDQAIIDDIEAEYPVDIGTPSDILISKGVCLLPVTYYEIKGNESEHPVDRPIVSTLPAGVAGPTAALVSYRWTGLEPSTELRAFFGYWTAKNASEFKTVAQTSAWAPRITSLLTWTGASGGSPWHGSRSRM